MHRISSFGGCNIAQLWVYRDLATIVSVGVRDRLTNLMRTWYWLKMSPVVYLAKHPRALSATFVGVPYRWKTWQARASQCYRKHIKSQNLNIFRLVLQFTMPNPMKPGVKSRMKMKLEQRRQALLLPHLSEQTFYCLLRCISYWRFNGKYVVPLNSREAVKIIYVILFNANIEFALLICWWLVQ